MENEKKDIALASSSGVREARTGSSATYVHPDLPRARSRDGRISIDKRFKEIAVGVSFQLNYLLSGIRDRDCVRFADFQSFRFNRERLFLFLAGFFYFAFLL